MRKVKAKVKVKVIRPKAWIKETLPAGGARQRTGRQGRDGEGTAQGPRGGRSMKGGGQNEGKQQKWERSKIDCDGQPYAHQCIRCCGDKSASDYHASINASIVTCPPAQSPLHLVLTANAPCLFAAICDRRRHTNQ